MARALGLFPSALIAAAENSGAGVYYKMLRELGIAPRQSEAYALYRMAKTITSAGTDMFSDLGSNPAEEEVLNPWPSNKATGIMQNISLVYRDRTTGQVTKTYYKVTSGTGYTREEATAMAIQAYSNSAEAYNQDLIGAVHTSAYRLVPQGF